MGWLKVLAGMKIWRGGFWFEMVRLEGPWVLHFKMYGFFQISINLPLLNV